MSYISVVLFCRYANHICISHTTRTNYEDECDSPPTISTPYILANFSFGEEHIGLVFIMISHMHVHK
jgi:hypothetical protein